MKKTLKAILIGAVVAAVSSSAYAQVDASAVWSKHCASCHGKDGKGDTKAGKKAKVKDLTDAKHQASFSDEQAFKSIKFGMREGDRELMKPFEDKVSDAEIEALVKFLRNFAKK
jgi:mono/diheme cytochrome c family protein